jgi:DNA-binding transcriptional regulator YdaS (Cro superfamily)
MRSSTGLNFFEAMIVHFGGMNKAAEALGCTRQAINNWKARGGVPLAAVENIEKLTDGKVNREMI